MITIVRILREFLFNTETIARVVNYVVSKLFQYHCNIEWYY